MTSNSSNTSKRSLLGYEDKDEEAFVKSTHEQIKAQNEAKLGQLAEGSELLMRTVKDIDVELGLSREQLSSLHALMEQTQGGLKSVMARMQAITHTASSRHIFYLVLFIVGLLFLLFYWFRQ